MLSNHEAKDRLFNAFIDSDSLDVIVNEIATVLGNPITVLDTTFYATACSDTAGVDDPFWLRGVERRCCPYEFASRINASNIPNEFGKYAILEDVDIYRRKLFKLLSSGRCVGYFNILESRTKFESVPDDLYVFAQRILSKSVLSEISPPHAADGNTQDGQRLLFNLLHAHFPDRILFQEFFQGSEISDSSLSCSLFTIDTKNRQIDLSMGEPLSTLLHGIFSKSWSLFDYPYIVFLAELNPDPVISESQVAALSKLLLSYHLRAGMSDPIRDFFFFQTHYQQALDALKYSDFMSEKHPVVRYDKFKHLKMLADLPKDWTINTYCSNFIWAIHEYDLVKGTEYLPTLYHYLLSNRSVIAAANSLFIHRNTVSYRIDRIKEIFSLDFDDADENFRLYQSCLILKYHGLLPA